VPWNASSPLRTIDCMIELPLAGKSGLVALIDDQDAHLLEMAWYAMTTPYTTYVFRATNGTTELMHRVIMKASCRLTVDHRSGNGLDNRRANLRLATNAQNARESFNQTTRPVYVECTGVNESRDGGLV
jgi:hypothetical protein